MNKKFTVRDSWSYEGYIWTAYKRNDNFWVPEKSPEQYLKKDQLEYFNERKSGGFSFGFDVGNNILVECTKITVYNKPK